MAYTNHRFCWHGVISTDTSLTTPFYAEVLGSKVMTMPMGDQEATMFAGSDGAPFAHTNGPMVEGQPSHWSSYLRVADVDASAKAAAEHGGALIVPPTDIPPGRFATVSSPSGAVFHLFLEAGADATDAADVDGGIHWVELHSSDLDTDLAWLAAAFGISTQIMPMPTGPYHILMSGETTVGGAVTQQHEGAPSMWLPWVRIDEVDAAVARVAGNGGKVVAPCFDVPGVGRLAILADPTGGVVGVIKPAPAAS